MAQESKAPGSSAGPARRRLAVWKKAMVVASVALMIVGAGLQGYAYVSGGEEKPAAAESSGAGKGGGGGVVPGRGFLPGAPSPSGEEQTTTAAEQPAGRGLSTWAPAIFRLGFSFFVGFCIAYALRTFFKISLAAMGVILLVLFGLQYAGVLKIDWHSMEGHYDSVVRWLGPQMSSFKNFIAGQLPSAGMAVFGLVVGFRR